MRVRSILAVALLVLGGRDALALAPTRAYKTTPEKLKLKFEPLKLVATDSTRLDGWWFPGPPSSPVVVMAGSGVGNQADLLPAVSQLLKRGFTVMTFDYRGFGPSGSGPSDSLRRLVYSSAWVRDMAGALKAARQRAGPHRHVFAYGTDLGSGVSIAAAARTRTTDGVVVDGLWAMTREYVLNAGLSQDYRAVQYMNTQVETDDEPAIACVSLKVPLMLITCECDSLMPPVNAQAAARGATVRLDIWNVQDARHGESIAKSPDYYERLTRWFKMLAAIPRQP